MDDVGQPKHETAAWLHDFRHSSATNTLIGHIRAGGDVQQMMPVLSAWLRHVSPVLTSWCLQSTPELAAALGARLPPQLPDSGAMTSSWIRPARRVKVIGPVPF